MVDAYSKYPCIHPTSSITAQNMMELLEQDFTHFGYHHELVSDNAPTFMSDDFQRFLNVRGIKHVTGVPYHPATNGQAERMVQTFKKSLNKSVLPPKEALNEFLMQYRRTPLTTRLSPCELLLGRQIRSRVDILRPFISAPLRENPRRDSRVFFSVGKPCYAKYFGPKRDRQPRWIPAVIQRILGPRLFQVKCVPQGNVWRRHLDQIRPRNSSWRIILEMNTGFNCLMKFVPDNLFFKYSNSSSWLYDVRDRTTTRCQVHFNAANILER